ncbi:MarR family winged helix-turn-helix transcriptional regulator [Microbacterium oleivorans]|uniref:MarR family transcriptional regulator n=2 Tax=Microbacterium oleivorans TaxID=273677 RepID=A0A031FUY4_9MICO|nr:MarR family transcriptional regulator [Microbacterium oleivorans]AZS43071.1 HTH-type transcriptional regulator MhqR [Microbacterium oleivorans]EZP28092.1 MarR family transcriptional regulator [Microbacterium oleivorans]THE08178.1 MarR family transcriptional regulator [Microbacterium oleivorans]
MDHVDRILAQWRRARPGLDVSPMAVIGRLGRAAAVVDARLAATFASHGIDAGTFDVLATLARQGEPFRITPAELAADAMITSSAVAQRLNRLDRLGLVVREPNPDDGRGKFVRLTDAGRELLDAVLPDHLVTEREILAPLSVEERDTLAGLLSKLAGGG